MPLSFPMLSSWRMRSSMFLLPLPAAGQDLTSRCRAPHPGLKLARFPRLNFLLYLIGFLCCASSLTAQRIDSLSDERASPVAKISLTTLFEYEGFLQLGIEQRIRPNLSAQVAFGYGWPGFSLSNDTYRPGGLQVYRAELRCYTGRLRKGRPAEALTGSYWAVESSYKTVDLQKLWTQTRDEAGQHLATPRPRQSPVERQVLAFIVKWGRQFRLIRRNTRFLLDIYTGLGVRITHTQHQDASLPGYSDAFFFDRFRSVGRQVSPNFALGIQAGYRIW